MSITDNVTFSYFGHIVVVCESTWTFFTVFHLEFDKEAISDGLKAHSRVLREEGIDFK